MGPLPDTKYILHGMKKGRNIGAISGSIAGGLLGGLPKSDTDSKGNVHDRTTKERVVRGVLGALSFGHLGRTAGGLIGGTGNARKWAQGHRPSEFLPQKPDWLKNAKNKSEARAAWRTQARKVHPDLGGNANDFIKSEEAWSLFGPTYKEAMITGFSDELHKIAMLGAMLGGAAGYKLAPNTIKGKLLGSGIGAGLGQLAENSGRLAKRKLVDEPHLREQQELYGYQPYAQATPAQNFY